MTNKAGRGGSVQNRASDEFKTWEKPDLSLISEDDRHTYVCRYKALELYSDGECLEYIQMMTGIKPSKVVYFAKRCMEISPKGNPWGCLALMPHKRIKIYTRSAVPTNVKAGTRGGYSGSLGWIINKYPQLPELLRKEVLKIKKNQVHEHSLSPRTLHHIFLDTLKKLGAPSDCWPFTAELQGLRTIQSYFQVIIGKDFNAYVAANEESAAKAHLAVGTGHRPLLVSNQPYDFVEVDAWSMECHTSVDFMTPEGVVAPIKITRIWVLLMVECGSGAVVCYRLVFKSEVSAEDVVDLFRDALQLERERPRPLVTGLVYPEGSGLPGEVITECKGAVWASVKLDGALVNLSEKITNLSRRELGYSWTVGRPAHFEKRPLVERINAALSQEFARMPSTTGHGPGHGRAPNGELLAVRHRINADEIHHLLDVLICTHNVTPTEGRYMSPLEYLRMKLSADNNHLILRHIPHAAVQNHSHILLRRQQATVRGGRKTGRAPYVQFARVRYTNDALRGAYALIGKKIVLTINESDIRYLNAYTVAGESLGVLIAAGHWVDTKHSLTTRQALNKLVSQRIISITREQDPIQIYMKHLTTKQQTTRKNKEGALTSSRATEAKRVSDETGLPLNIIEKVPGDGYPSVLTVDPENLTESGFAPMPDLNEMLRKSRKR